MTETEQDRKSTYSKGSLTLGGAVAMGTGVMIGAGIFALTGQVAEFAGPLFPAAFLLAAIISAFSAYTYIKMSNKYPSAGGIAMISIYHAPAANRHYSIVYWPGLATASIRNLALRQAGCRRMIAALWLR